MEGEEGIKTAAASSSDEEEKVLVPKKEDKKPKKAKCKKKRILTINLTYCKYDSVCRVAKRFGLKPVGDEEDWSIFWTDTSVLLERVMDMKRYQKINHFPGMIEICRKDLLARNMNRMLKLFPKEYSIFPRSWCLPADFGDFQAFCRSKKNKTFISKPESGCQGKGIFVFKNPKDVKPGEHCVIQQYISKPFIIDGFKFDLRIYVLVTSCDPLRVYVYKDGLGRFATVKYHDPSGGNVDEQCMHLTNYAINKASKDFVRDDDSGSKRRITTVNQWFIEHGYNIDRIWTDIEDVIIKTLIAAHPILKHNYRSCFPNHSRGSACFEILGFDILLDKKLKPWLIEVNHSPSFHTDAPLDKEVKEGLLYDTLNLIDLYSNDKRKCMEEDKRKVKERLLRQKSKEASQISEDDIRAKYAIHLEKYEKTHMGGFRKIYPQGNEEPYVKLFNQSTSLCAETAASRARCELSKLQREDIESKQKELENYRKKLSGSKVGGKGDDVRPESPTGEKKAKAGLLPKRRVPTLRIPLYTSKAGLKSADTTPTSEEIEKEKPADVESTLVPYGEGVAPLSIRDEEELERLAGLQLRDSLVRGLRVSEQLQASLKCGVCPANSNSSVQSTATKSDLFSCRYHTQTLEPSKTSDYEQRVLGLTRATPLHLLPGSMKRSSNESSASTSTLNVTHTNHWPATKPNLPRRHHAAHHSTSGAQCKPSRYMHIHTSGSPYMGHHHHRMQPYPTMEKFNAEALGLSVISAPIRLATRSHAQPVPPWNSSEMDEDVFISTTRQKKKRLGILATHTTKS